MTTADVGGQTQTATTNDFGENQELGSRLDYTKPKYNDLWAAILFVLHVITLLVLAIVVIAGLASEANEGTPSPTALTTPSPTSSGDLTVGEILTGVAVVLLICMVVGIVFGLIWLQLMKMFAIYIIKGLLFFNMFCWVLLIVLGLIMPAIPVVVVGAIGLLIVCLYTWCVWSRIPFASVLLSIASTIASTYEGTIIVSLMTCVFDFVWYIIWALAVAAFASSPARGEVFIWFLLLVSLYWGYNVFKNVSHTTTCGVAATWYFSTSPHKPSRSAFKRTMTTSFGSVCFGSLLVAILQATRALLRGMRRGPCFCIAMCCLCCIEALMRYFNMYAFAQVAIYGSSFFQAAKATWNLLSSRGIDAIINDDLTGLALSCGAFFGFVVSAFAGYFVSTAFFGTGAFGILASVLLAIYGGIVGYALCVLILLVVRSGVVALFVCFAEDPATMAANRPKEYGDLTGAHPGMATVGSGQTWDPEGKITSERAVSA
jgi:hypothetical protein